MREKRQLPRTRQFTPPLQSGSGGGGMNVSTPPAIMTAAAAPAARGSVRVRVRGYARRAAERGARHAARPLTRRSLPTRGATHVGDASQPHGAQRRTAEEGPVVLAKLRECAVRSVRPKESRGGRS
jgi:hypothetical protein